MQEDTPNSVLADAPQEFENVDDCWSLLLAEGGEHRLDNLSQLLSLTSIIEREYTHISATRLLSGKSSNGSGKLK